MRRPSRQRTPWNDGPVDAAAWAKAGLLTPDEAGTAERIALLEYLTARGATLEQMVEAHRLGRLPGVAGDLVVGTGRSVLSVEEIAAGADVTEDRVRRVLLAAGLPATADSTLPADLVDLMSAFEQGASLMGEDAILAFTGVLGAAAITVAEAAVALFYAELGPGAAREGTDELARARVAETATTGLQQRPRGAVPSGGGAVREGRPPDPARPGLAVAGWGRCRRRRRGR